MAGARKIQQDLKTGEYYAKIQRNGVRKYFWLGDNLKEARRRLKRVERDIASGKIAFVEQETTALVQGGKRDIALAELAVRHLEWVRAHRAPDTFRLRRHYVLQFLEMLDIGKLEDGDFEITGSMLVSELTRAQLTVICTQIRNANPHRPNAGNELLRNVKTMLLWGVEEELCDLSFRKFPTMNHAPAKTKRVELEHLEKLFEVAPADLVDLVQFALLTGLRPIELRELTVDQVERPDSGVWFIRIEMHKTAGRTRETVSRTVPLGDKAREILQRQVATHPKSKFVFLNAGGKPYTRTVLRNRLIRWCRRAGIPDITPYALRHGFASIMSDNRVETTALARLMGHSTVRTLGRYVSNSRDHDLQAMQTAEDVLNKALGESE